VITEFNIDALRSAFPILDTEVNGRPLIYLDNGATSQKPQPVIDTIERYYSEQNANIHRGVHQLSQRATQSYEDARETVRGFLGAGNGYEVLFTKGTTDGINLVASSWGRKNLQPGDEVIISTMEHHSNIVPWQMICEEREASLKVIPILDSGDLDMNAFDALLTSKTKMVATVHVSNSLGTINPVEEIIKKSHAVGAKVLLDGAQSVPHMRVDVKALDIDFYTFSGHKIFGPTGVGILYGKEALLNAMPPYQGGGDMIEKVTFEKTTYNTLPHKFEAGTPNIVGGIGLAAAIDFVSQYDPQALIDHEQDLLEYTTTSLLSLNKVRIIGTAEKKASVISFVVDGLHPFDVGTLLDQQGIAVRTGHHCTQPLMDRFGIPGTIRASFAIYNNRSDADALVQGLAKAIDMLS